LAAIGLASAVLFFWVVETFGFSVDDSFIYFRYAENVAGGHGFVFNPGETPGDGFTSWGWLFLLSLASFVGFELILASKILGLLFLALSTFFLYLTAVQLCGENREKRWVSFLIASFLVFNFQLVAHSLSGMETALYIFSLVVLIYCVTRLWFGRFSDRRSWLLFGLSAAFVFFVRPEGLAAGGIAAVSLGFRHGKDIGRIKIWLTGLFGWILPVGLFLSWKVLKFGSPLPLSYYHKVLRSPESFRLSFRHLFNFFSDYCGLVLLAVFCLIYAVFFLKEKIYLFYALLFILMIAVYLPFMPIMNYLHRFFIPYLVLLLILLSPGIHFLFSLSGRFKSKNVQTLFISSIFFLILFGMNIGLRKDLSTVRFWGKMVDPSQYRAKLGKVMGLLPSGVVVANTEMGVIPYFSGLTCLDMAGLTDPVIARKGLTMEYLVERGTDIILFPRDVSTLDINWFRESGRSYEKIFLSESFNSKFESMGSFVAWPDDQSKYYFYMNRDSRAASEIRDWALKYLE